MVICFRERCNSSQKLEGTVPFNCGEIYFLLLQVSGRICAEESNAETCIEFAAYQPVSVFTHASWGKTQSHEEAVETTYVEIASATLKRYIRCNRTIEIPQRDYAGPSVHILQTRSNGSACGWMHFVLTLGKVAFPFAAPIYAADDEAFVTR